MTVGMRSSKPWDPPLGIFSLKYCLCSLPASSFRKYSSVLERAERTQAESLQTFIDRVVQSSKPLGHAAPLEFCVGPYQTTGSILSMLSNTTPDMSPAISNEPLLSSRPSRPQYLSATASVLPYQTTHSFWPTLFSPVPE